MATYLFWLLAWLLCKIASCTPHAYSLINSWVSLVSHCPMECSSAYIWRMLYSEPRVSYPIKRRNLIHILTQSENSACWTRSKLQKGDLEMRHREDLSSRGSGVSRILSLRIWQVLSTRKEESVRQAFGGQRELYRGWGGSITHCYSQQRR